MDGDAVWLVTWVGLRDHVLDGGAYPQTPRIRGIVGVVGFIEKQCELLLWCTEQEQQ